jgi:hypothetical protein
LHNVTPDQIEEENATSQKGQTEDRPEKPSSDSTATPRAGADLDGQHQAEVRNVTQRSKEKNEAAPLAGCVTIQGKSPLVEMASMGMMKAWQVGQQPGGASVPPFKHSSDVIGSGHC